MATTQDTTIPQIQWLTCRITKGMFSDELAVTYPAEGMYQKSVFVPASEVEGEPGSLGRVRVRVICRNGLVMAVLPSANQDFVTASQEDVSPQ